MTPIYKAAENGNVKAIQVLAELGANANAPQNNGMTAVFMTAGGGRVDMVGFRVRDRRCDKSVSSTISSSGSG